MKSDYSILEQQKLLADLANVKPQEFRHIILSEVYNNKLTYEIPKNQSLIITKTCIETDDNFTDKQAVFWFILNEKPTVKAGTPNFTVFSDTSLLHILSSGKFIFDYTNIGREFAYSISGFLTSPAIAEKLKPFETLFSY
jgi:hypothetical protein